MHILHETIGVPRLKIDMDGKNKAVLTVGPLPSGYGMTVGNALRRVLLSSLPGTAVTAIKVPGASHEYDSIEGVKDSVLDIILNLRSLRLKKHSKGTEDVELVLPKKGEVTAADIKVSSDVEILDPAHVITSCDGTDGKIKLVLRVEKGLGYQVVTNEQNAAEQDPEIILMDANFSPVKRVKYEVKPTRVGEQTDLDQLVLEVETDGSLEADKCIKLSAQILQSYFTLFNEEEAYSDEEFTTSFASIKAREEAERQSNAFGPEETFTPIDILGFSQRTLNALVNGGITSVEELLKTPMSQLTQLRGFGQKAKNELEQILKERGYTTDESGINPADAAE